MEPTNQNQSKPTTRTGLDKTAWGEGPWQHEPDRAEWRDEATGLPCLALRHEHYGHWCGYVAIPADHPWNDADDLYDVETHGEITYGPARCQPEREERLPWLRVCHTPQPGESDDVRWVGFDCGHQGYHDPDYEPGSDWNPRGATYRDLTYVEAQCALLAKQAKAEIPDHSTQRERKD
jgi:hypothetical protein